MKLSKTEELIMELLWKSERAFLKELMDIHPEPKPAMTTVATLLKRMQNKGFVGYTLFGNSRQYYPLVNKEDYFAKHVKGIIKNYFGNSALRFASFFTTTSNLTPSELEELKKIIDGEINRKA